MFWYFINWILVREFSVSILTMVGGIDIGNVGWRGDRRVRGRGWRFGVRGFYLK